MADTPRPEHKAFAADARSMFDALTAEGFEPDQATALLCTLIGSQGTSGAPQSDRAARQAKVAALLGGQKSPTEDRSAGLWNPPAPTPGAPAHD